MDLRDVVLAGAWVALFACSSTSTNESGTTGGGGTTAGGSGDGGGATTGGGAGGSGATTSGGAGGTGAATGGGAGGSGAATGGGGSAGADAGDGGPSCTFTSTTSPKCLAPVNSPGAQLLLVHFDSGTQPSAPTGWPFGPSNSAPALVAGACSNAASFKTSDQYVSYPEKLEASSSSVIDYAKGTIALWYKPFFNPMGPDPDDHTLLRPDNVDSKGGLYLMILGANLDAGATGARVLRFTFRPSAGSSVGATVRLSACPMLQDQWAHIAVSWEPGKPMRFYANGTKVPDTAYLNSPQSPAGTARVPSEGGKLYVGAYADKDSANGAIDELLIYDAPLP